ncbi:MAG: helix-turn-helix domain-containing protein [Bacteroidales bacterium]|nr:helix-turn-helix domain-containing protein [Bacteroidales bacterium]
MILENYIYIIPAAVSLFWVVRTFLLKDINEVQLLTIAGMFMATLSLLCEQATAFIFPFFFLSVRQKVSTSGITKWDRLIFLPSIVAVLPGCGGIFHIFLAVQISAISVWAAVSISKYGKKLADVYDESEVSADDIRQVMIFIILSVIAVTVATFLPDGIKSYVWVQIVFSTFISVLLFFVGYYTFSLKKSIPQAETFIEIGKDTAGTPGKDERLLQRVTDEKLYLDPYLSLVSLAEKLHTNRTYLSASIHSCKGQNFSDYINTLRVAHFIETINSGEYDGIKDAAMKSGYNNLQSFYRHFSEIMQMTPKTWISHNKK